MAEKYKYMYKPIHLKISFFSEYESVKIIMKY